jgi:hypothetical protein
MHIKHIHELMEKLSESACYELCNGIENVDTCEMGAVVDMIKDLADAEYHARIAKEMEKAEEEDKEEEKYLLKMFKEEYGEDDGRRHYDDWRYSSGRFAPKGRGRRMFEERADWHMTPEMYRDMDMKSGRMYTDTPRKHYTEEECKYAKAMKKYKETRNKHTGGTQEDVDAKLHELECYMGELTHDVVGLIGEMTPEERTMTKAKLSTLVSKI